MGVPSSFFMQESVDSLGSELLIAFFVYLIIISVCPLKVMSHLINLSFSGIATPRKRTLIRKAWCHHKRAV